MNICRVAQLPASILYFTTTTRPRTRLSLWRTPRLLMQSSLIECSCKTNATTIEINRPEIEALIQQRLHSGAFESVEEVIYDALEVQREREAWLEENKEAIDAKIGRGLAQLDRGEVIPGEQLRERLAADKRRGSRTTLEREIVHRRAGSGRRSPADLALLIGRGGLGGRRPHPS